MHRCTLMRTSIYLCTSVNLWRGFCCLLKPLKRLNDRSRIVFPRLKPWAVLPLRAYRYSAIFRNFITMHKVFITIFLLLNLRTSAQSPKPSAGSLLFNNTLAHFYNINEPGMKLMFTTFMGRHEFYINSFTGSKTDKFIFTEQDSISQRIWSDSFFLKNIDSLHEHVRGSTDTFYLWSDRVEAYQRLYGYYRQDSIEISGHAKRRFDRLLTRILNTPKQKLENRGFRRYWYNPDGSRGGIISIADGSSWQTEIINKGKRKIVWGSNLSQEQNPKMYKLIAWIAKFCKSPLLLDLPLDLLELQ